MDTNPSDHFGFHTQFQDPLDVGIGEAMDVAFEILTAHSDNHDTPEQLKLRIAAHNIKALCTVLLMADDIEGIGIDTKQLVLGLLGTADWLAKDLPPLEGEINGDD